MDNKIKSKQEEIALDKPAEELSGQTSPTKPKEKESEETWLEDLIGVVLNPFEWLFHLLTL
ncbi:MAG: hypothetical protein LIP09_08720 [Bacteroidales bacterium]|nr:hypothetical protein [Bacteroidales bacterium]